MLIVHFWLLVTLETGILGIVAWIVMAFHTIVPYLSLPVLSTVNGEILAVMIEFRWSPARIGGMASSTIGREVCRYVVGILGAVIIILMAVDTIGRKPCIGAIGMALGTILYIMTLCQREKVVVDRGWGPTWIGRVARCTIGGKP